MRPAPPSPSQPDAAQDGPSVPRWRSVVRRVLHRARRRFGVIAQRGGEFINQRVFAHAPVVLLLTMGTVILHSLHVLDHTEGYFMRWVVQTALTSDAGRDPPPRELDQQQRVQVIEASAAMRVKELEYGDNVSPIQLARVGGVRPVDREKFAQVLQFLAKRLKAEAEGAAGQNKRRPWVVAIDVDVTPLPIESDLPAPPPAEASAASAMAKALIDLRQQAVVIAIIYDRPLQGQRHARNLFMVEQAHCTRAKGSAPVDVGAPYPLYFASPRVFHDLQRGHAGYPLSFAFGLKNSPNLNGLQSAGSHFPSLSNLAHLHLFGEASPQAGGSPLTLLCDQAASALQHPSGPGLLLEDLVSGWLPSGCERSALPQGNSECRPFNAKQYRLRGINWRWLDSDRLARVELDSGCQLLAGSCTRPGMSPLDGSHLQAQVLILGVDGGARHDKYEVASVTPDPISGATLHALQVLSARNDQDLNSHSVWAIVIDVLVGLLFLLVCSLALRLLQLARRWPRTLLNLLRVPMPVFVALLLSWMAVEYLCPWLLGMNIWVNPAYLLVGMAIHAYIENSALADERQPTHRHAADFSFGLRGWWSSLRAWAPVFGGQIDGGGVVSVPRPSSVQVIDDSLNALVQWSLLGYGGFVVLEHYLSRSPGL